jgi:hypothetical protein
MHLKKLFKNKEFLYYTGGPLCTVQAKIFILEYLFLGAFSH